jgi:hypothetical protein
MHLNDSPSVSLKKKKLFFLPVSEFAARKKKISFLLVSEFAARKKKTLLSTGV